MSGVHILTRYAFGYSALARLATDHSLVKWQHGEVAACMNMAERLMPLLMATRHAPSIMQGWMNLAKILILFGCHPISLALLRQTVEVFSASAHPTNKLMATVHQCSVVALSVWTSGGDGSAPPLPFDETELLQFIQLMVDTGDLYGGSFHLIIHCFPFLLDFRADLSLTVHAAMLNLVQKYAKTYGFGMWSTEALRMEATLHIRHLQHQHHQRLHSLPQSEGALSESSVSHRAEAVRLLGLVRSKITRECLLTLKWAMTSAELHLLDRTFHVARDQLRSALTNLPDPDYSGFYYVNSAKRMLAEIERML